MDFGKLNENEGLQQAPSVPADKLTGTAPLSVLPRALKIYSAAGRNAAGAITVTGTKVGDLVIGAIGFVTSSGVLTSGSAGASFESVVTVADQIQQSSASNLSANTYVFFVQPQS